MAKSKNDERYFNFPIQLLGGFMIDSVKSLGDINRFAIYENCLKLEHGTEEEKMISSASFYNMALNNPAVSLREGIRLYRSIPSNVPRAGLNLSIFWDFYQNEKSDFDKICLLGFLAIKSILQKNTYCKIDNKYWLSRMDGKSKSVSDYGELSNEIRIYANEYQTKKIKMALRDNWGLVTYSRYTRGFYISYSLTLEQLIYEAEKRRKATKENQYKQEEKEALKKVLEKLNKTRA